MGSYGPDEVVVLPLPRVQYEWEFTQAQVWGLESHHHSCPNCGHETGERVTKEGTMYECLIGFGGCHSRFWLDGR